MSKTLAFFVGFWTGCVWSDQWVKRNFSTKFCPRCRWGHSTCTCTTDCGGREWVCSGVEYDYIKKPDPMRRMPG